MTIHHEQQEGSLQITTGFNEYFQPVSRDTPSPATDSSLVFADFELTYEAKKGYIDIDDFIDELCAEDPEFAGEIAGAGSWAADTLYPGESSLKTLRLRAGLSQRQLADKIESSQAHVWRMENDTEDLRISTIDKVAGALGIDPEKLFSVIRKGRHQS